MRQKVGPRVSRYWLAEIFKNWCKVFPERMFIVYGWDVSVRLWPLGNPLSGIVQVSVNVTPAALSMAVATFAAHPISVSVRSC